MKLAPSTDEHVLSPPPAASPHSTDDLVRTSKAGGLRRLVRHRKRQQQIDRHAERLRSFLMQRYRPLAFSGFEIGEIALCYAYRRNQFDLRHAPPFAQDTNRILARREPVDHPLGQYDFAAGCDGFSRPSHEPRRADVLVGGKGGESLVLALRKHCEFLAARSLDELNLRHLSLSLVNLSPVSYGRDNNSIAFFVKDDAPISDAQTRAGTPLQTLDSASPRSGEIQELRIQTPAHIGRETDPLARCCGRKCNLHEFDIAKSNIFVNQNIAVSDSRCRI
jgi:hypothetical protein